MEQQIYTYDSLEEIKKHGHPGFPFQTYDTIYKKILYGQRYYQDSISIEDIADVSLTA